MLADVLAHISYLPQTGTASCCLKTGGTLRSRSPLGMIVPSLTLKLHLRRSSWTRPGAAIEGTAINIEAEDSHLPIIDSAGEADPSTTSPPRNQRELKKN